jgi:hypothetical protein
VGYFRRRISRHRCAAHVAAAVARQAGADLSFWVEATLVPPARSAARATYLRFAVNSIHSVSREQLGVFQAAYGLRDSGRLARRDLVRLREVMQWFCRNLKGPDVDGRAIFWFRFDAQECIEQIWEMIRLLKRYDYTVWMMRSEPPGRTVYSDAYQIAAVPWASRRWRRRAV